MRSLYLILGFLLGTLFTLDHAERVITHTEATWNKHVSIAALTGYHHGRQEGYRRGIERARINWIACEGQLSWTRGYIAHIIQHTGYKDEDTEWRWKE